MILLLKYIFKIESHIEGLNRDLVLLSEYGFHRGPSQQQQHSQEE